MITLRFGLQADMRGSSFTSPALNSVLGNITAIAGHTRTTVTAGTVNGGSVVFDGKFKFSNESSLLNSDVTGVSFFDKSHHLLLSVSGAPKVTFNDVGSLGKAQTMASYLLHDAGHGITVQGSAFNDILLGYGGSDHLFGNAGNDFLRGGAGDDFLNGGLGADRLDGGAGKDVMTGGKGDDLYVIDRATDQVVESVGGGNDTAYSSATWTMGAQLENLTLTGTHAISGTGNASDNVMIGNVAANTLRGLGGDDHLDGGRGADRMEGGRGNDVYIVDNAKDVVIELANQGTDTVHASISYQLPANVENLTLLGSLNLDGVGNNLDNELRGNEGNNVLNAGHGHDVLTGGGGADSFVVAGGAGDTLSITDLLSGTDHLFITPQAVGAMAAGPVAADQLRASTDTPDTNDFLVYDHASGILSYDATGNGTGPLVTLVSLGADRVLLADDITIGLPPHV